MYGKSPLRVVIDTNVFISSFFGGIPRIIINLWKNGEITLCISEPIVDEYLKVLCRLGVAQKEEMEQLARLFARKYHCLFASVTPYLEVVQDDPDDNKFLECAVALDARIIVSGDKHLKNVNKYMGIHIMSPREFLDSLNGIQSA